LSFSFSSNSENPAGFDRHEYLEKLVAYSVGIAATVQQSVAWLYTNKNLEKSAFLGCDLSLFIKGFKSAQPSPDELPRHEISP